MITTFTYTKSEEQITFTLECGSIGELVSRNLSGEASFKKEIEEHLAKSTGTYSDLQSLAFGAAKRLGLQLSVRHEGEPPDPDDLEFD